MLATEKASHHYQIPAFDKKYKTVIVIDYTLKYSEMMYWLDNNSKGLVDIKINHTQNKQAVHIGFENTDDALFFKIRFSI